MPPASYTAVTVSYRTPYYTKLYPIAQQYRTLPFTPTLPYPTVLQLHPTTPYRALSYPSTVTYCTPTVVHPTVPN